MWLNTFILASTSLIAIIGYPASCYVLLRTHDDTIFQFSTFNNKSRTLNNKRNTTLAPILVLNKIRNQNNSRRQITVFHGKVHYVYAV